MRRGCRNNKLFAVFSAIRFVSVSILAISVSEQPENFNEGAHYQYPSENDGKVSFLSTVDPVNSNSLIYLIKSGDNTSCAHVIVHVVNVTTINFNLSLYKVFCSIHFFNGSCEVLLSSLYSLPINSQETTTIPGVSGDMKITRVVERDHLVLYPIRSVQF
jgi:hypothetical protein